MLMTFRLIGDFEIDFLGVARGWAGHPGGVALSAFLPFLVKLAKKQPKYCNFCHFLQDFLAQDLKYDLPSLPPTLPRPPPPRPPSGEVVFQVPEPVNLAKSVQNCNICWFSLKNTLERLKPNLYKQSGRSKPNLTRPKPNLTSLKPNLDCVNLT